LQDAAGDGATGASGASGGAFGGGAGQVVEVGAFGLIQLEGAGEGVEDVRGSPAELAALYAGVVLDADTGEQGDFFATQAGHAPVAAVGGQPGLLRRDLGAAGSEEFSDVALGAHVSQVRPIGSNGGCPVSTRNDRTFSSP
jgi:hypothetical protein